MKSVVIQAAGGGCGICHSDGFVKEGHWPGLVYPREPGHEVAGVIDTVGEGVTAWTVGDRLQITGFHFDGGYQRS